jgi:hypothetical protein
MKGDFLISLTQTLSGNIIELQEHRHPQTADMEPPEASRLLAYHP